MEKIEWIREAAGDRFERIELEVGAYFVVVGENSEANREAVEVIATRTGLSVESVLGLPHTLVGSVAEICEALQRRRDRFGFSYITVGSGHIDQFAPVVEALSGT